MSEAENREEGAAAPARAKIVSPKERSKRVPIEYPVEFNGEVWDHIPISRVSGKEMEEYAAAVGRGENVLPPTVRCPIEVWDAMDADDQATVDEAALDFTPRRLKAAVELIRSNGAPSSGK